MCVRDIEFTYFYDFLLNAGTVPRVWYWFLHFIIGYEKKTAELQLLKKKDGCDPSSVIKIDFFTFCTFISPLK